jgi:dTDP-4-amino-4,6-dideoxygalactose transaminase
MRSAHDPSTTPPPVPLTRPATDDAEQAAVAQVLASGWLAGQGPWGTELEKGFTELTGRAHAVALNNCTAGLHLALSALGVGPGDEVLVADYSFPATGHAVLYCGATPVFVDVRPDTGTLDPDLAEAAVTPRTRGIVAVDALGMPADWHALEEISRRHGLFLVEDAACSAGGLYEGRPCGSFGDVAVFSLHARKGITCGEGGVLCTDDAALAERVRRRASFGMTSALDRQAADTITIPAFTELGHNYKLSDVLAAIATVQLGKLGEFLGERRRIAARYAGLLAGIPEAGVPAVPPGRSPTWQTYAVTVGEPLDRDAMIKSLRESGIGCNIGTYALHRQEVYGGGRADCPVSGRLFERHLALPMYVGLTDAEQDRVVAALAAAAAAAR